MYLPHLKKPFQNKALLKTALTHSSYANIKKGVESNENLEFLGDAVLQLCITRYLYEHRDQRQEGELTRLRALIVCEPSLYAMAKAWDIGPNLLLSKGEELTGGRNRAALLADAVEAIIAAVYLDQGYEAARNFIFENFKETIAMALNDEIILDYKTRLQELLQESGEVHIHYDLLRFEGPPHQRRFFSRVAIDDITMGRGEGLSKKESEQMAAKDALSKLATGPVVTP